MKKHRSGMANFREPPALELLIALSVGQITFSAAAFGGNGAVGRGRHSGEGRQSRIPIAGEPSNGGAGAGPQSSQQETPP
jgi:hypothetical protein